jgi:hypothetical protein
MAKKQYHSMSDFKPKTFRNKNGLTFQTRPHLAWFSPTHNSSRMKVYIVLYDRNHHQGDATGMSTGQLRVATGVSSNYLSSRLGKWVKWGFLKRAVGVVNGRATFVYSLAERGTHMVEDILPDEWLMTFINEMRMWKEKKSV